MKHLYKMLAVLALLLNFGTAKAQFSTGFAIDANQNITTYLALEAAFGPRVSQNLIESDASGILTFVKDIKGNATCCDSIAEDLTGKIAIIERGAATCDFAVRCLNAIKKGASAVIMVNTEDKFGIMQSQNTAITSKITAPCFLVRLSTGVALKDFLALTGQPTGSLIWHPNAFPEDAFAVKPGKYFQEDISGHPFFDDKTSVDTTTSTNSAYFVYAAKDNGSITVSSCDGGSDTDLNVYESAKVPFDFPNLLKDATNKWSNSGACAKDAKDTKKTAAELKNIPVKAGLSYYIEFTDKNYDDSSFYFNLAFVKKDSVNLKLSVDMKGEASIDAAGVYVAGSFQGWDPKKTALKNVVGTKVYEGTFRVASDATIEYKFVNGNAWGKDESVDNKGTCAAGKDGNRKVVVATSDVSVPTVCFKSCDACVNLTPKPDLTCEAKAIICDPFKSYPNGYLAAGTAAHWSVWDDDYATASPISITNTEFASDTKAMVIDYALAKPQQDAILKLGDATTGRYRLDWKMYVPTRLLRDTARSFAYYNLQHDITGSHNFSADVFFLSNKVAQFQIGSTTIARISYTPDSWMNISHDINIDKDTVIVSVGTQKVGWKWSRGINGATGASAPSKKLGGVDFYALKDSTKYYIDDVQFVKIPDPTTKVTFSVDMKNEKVDAAKGVCVAGSFQKAAGFPADWTPGTTKLVNKVGTTVWEVTLDLPVGKYEYKFINDDSWSGKEEKMNGKACEAGTSGNRSFSLATLTPITVGALCYNYCVTCDKVIATNDPKFDAAMSLYPNPSQDVINLDYNFATSVSLKVSVLNILGETVYTADMPEVNAGTATMDVHNLTSGAYMMRITDENNRQTVKRFVIER